MSSISANEEPIVPGEPRVLEAEPMTYGEEQALLNRSDIKNHDVRLNNSGEPSMAMGDEDEVIEAPGEGRRAA